MTIKGNIAGLVVTVILLQLNAVVSEAQSDFDLSMRKFNQLIYNPAAAGSSFKSNFFLQARAQWVGMEGAPTTEAIGLDHYSDNLNSGIGVVLTGDQIGFTNTYTARLAYSYYLPINYQSYISLGVSAALVNRNMNASGALVDALDDPDLYFGRTNMNSASFDLGIEYVGLVKLGAVVRNIGTQSTLPQFKTMSYNIWSYVSARFNLTYKLSIEPTLSYMHRDRFNRYELGAISYFSRSSLDRDAYWLGGMFRFHGQFSAMAGMKLTDDLQIGYSFDYAYGNLARISGLGTHEVFIKWYFGRSYCETNNCAAYNKANSRYNYKNKKKFLEEIKKRFEIY